MKISLVLNTNCMDPYASMHGNQWRKRSYAARVALLKETINLAKGAGWDEIIIAGNFEPGNGYKYIEVPPFSRSRADALIQREHGARNAIGDVLVFCHDDHRPGDSFPMLIEDYPEPWDLLIPKRIHYATNELLENGNHESNSLHNSYMGAHCLVMKRWLWAQVPWTSINTEYWDHSMTRLWKQAGAKLCYADDLVHYDMEAEEDEQ